MKKPPFIKNGKETLFNFDIFLFLLFFWEQTNEFLRPVFWSNHEIFLCP